MRKEKQDVVAAEVVPELPPAEPETVPPPTEYVFPPMPPAPTPPTSIRVRATRMGYYGNRLYLEGEEFTIQRSVEFSKKWMEKL